MATEPEGHDDGPAKVIVVAGGAGGIGRAVIDTCRTRSVIVASFVHRPSAPSPAAGPEYVVDVTDRTSVAAAFDRVASEVGSIAGVVNTVAVQDLGRLDELTDTEWDTTLRVNLTGAHHLTQEAARLMAASGRDGGSIVHIASIDGHRPAPSHGHYATSKAALIAYVRAAAAELGPEGIRVNSVSPGLCHRPDIETTWPDGVERWRSTSPLGRLVAPDDVANACWFLLSDQSGAVTGIDLVVDTGVMATAGW